MHEGESERIGLLGILEIQRMRCKRGRAFSDRLEKLKKQLPGDLNSPKPSTPPSPTPIHALRPNLQRSRSKQQSYYRSLHPSDPQANRGLASLSIKPTPLTSSLASSS